MLYQLSYAPKISQPRLTTERPALICGARFVSFKFYTIKIH